MNSKLTFAAAVILSATKAIDLEHRRRYDTLMVRHVEDQAACDNRNTDSAIYFFSQPACACVVISFDDDVCDNHELTLEDGCLDQCVIDQILDHGLDENCQIPDDDNDRLHKHSFGWHKHGRRPRGCDTRVSHRYGEVSLAGTGQDEFELDLSLGNESAESQEE